MIFSDLQKVIFSFALEGLASETPGTWTSDQPDPKVTAIGTLLDTGYTRSWSYGECPGDGRSYKLTLASVGTTAYKGLPNPIKGTLDAVLPVSPGFETTGSVTVHAECK